MQSEAQEELDRVVGAGRLPTFEDRENLPYLEGVIQESYRWYNVTPSGKTHVIDGGMRGFHSF